MTVLSVAQKAAAYIGMEVPDALMASTEREHIELREIIQDCAERIAFDVGHDWRLLYTLHTIAGDDATASFSLPSDFKRLGIDGQLWTTRLQYPLRVVDSIDAWLEIDIRNYDYVSGVWTMLGGNIEVKPTPASTETLKFYYQSNLIVSPSVGNNKAAFTADDDSFRLDERILKLCAVWAWKEAKGLEYAEDMQTYQDALSRAIVDDKPSRALGVGRRPHPWRGAKRAYPEALS